MSIENTSKIQRMFEGLAKSDDARGTVCYDQEDSLDSRSRLGQTVLDRSGRTRSRAVWVALLPCAAKGDRNSIAVLSPDHDTGHLVLVR